MKSMKLNNKAVFLYLTITEESTREEVQHAQLQINELLLQALKFYPENSVAWFNRYCL